MQDSNQGLWNRISRRLNACWKTDWAIEDQTKNLNSIARPNDGRVFSPLQWRHNGRDSVYNHQPHDCLLNRLFRRRSKKTSKLRVTGLCVGIHRGPMNSQHKWPVTRKTFPFDDVIMPLDPTAGWLSYLVLAIYIHTYKYVHVCVYLTNIH